jgi:hypothetical protein
VKNTIGRGRTVVEESAANCHGPVDTLPDKIYIDRSVTCPDANRDRGLGIENAATEMPPVGRDDGDFFAGAAGA